MSEKLMSETKKPEWEDKGENQRIKRMIQEQEDFCICENL